MSDSATTQIDIKLDGTNYAPWSWIIEMYISGKDKMLGYINGGLMEQEPNDPTFRRWRTKNYVVKGQLINSMELYLIFDCQIVMALSCNNIFLWK